jgi:hypothetical protein
MRKRYNLVFFALPKNGALRDLTEAAGLISAAHPEIHAVALSSRQRLPGIAALLGVATRPTLSVEVARPNLVPPLRGKRLRQLRGQIFRKSPAGDQPLSKIEEMQRLEAAGLPVPKWTEITADTVLDPAEWGPYVVVKPSIGGRGYEVVIRRTTRVRFKPPGEHDSLGRLGPMIAQEFIYTGRRPESIRVLTFLGRPISAIRYFGHSQPHELPGRFAFKETGGGIDIVAFDRYGSVDLVDDPEAIELARRAHALFPEVPTLGVDVLRDADTGKAYVIETNPQGPAWTLSSPGVGMHFRSREAVHRQFDGLRVIAEASAEAVYRLAR